MADPPFSTWPSYSEEEVEAVARVLRSNRVNYWTGEEGRKTVELFTAVYRSQRDRAPVKFPLQPENDGGFDGRGSSNR